MPIQAPQWTEFLSCPVCCNEFDIALRGPISLGCGHTICKACLSNLHRKQCPFDQTIISIDIESLPINTALLQLVSSSNKIDNDEVLDSKIVSRENAALYMSSKKCVEELAMYLKPFSNGNICGSAALLTRPMQRKLVTLINCQLVEDEGRTRAMRAARSLGERTVTELILQHQNPQQLSANLWAAVRARGCQFLGPAMQEDVLKLVLLALEDGSALSRKVLVMFVVQRLEPHFAQASKTSIGHVVQLLYRASCFKVSKRDGDSSLMQLKEEFRTYEALRREHDAQIVQIATEAGLRIAPDQWSALLYGDTAHKSHMQSIIDKLQTPQSFAQSVQELVIALQRTGDPGKLSVLRPDLELLAKIDSSSESTTPSWKDCSESLDAVKKVVAGLVEFIHQHGSRKVQDPVLTQHSKYKISMCRDLSLRGICPRSTNCTFAHSHEELEKAKNRKASLRNKEHGLDKQSPIDGVYQFDDYYPFPASNPTVNLPAVVSIPRVSYDVPFPNPNFPTNGPYPAPQTIYTPTTNYPPEVYPTAPSHNNTMVLANGGQYYTQTDFEGGPPTANQNTEMPKHGYLNWEQMMSKAPQIANNQPKVREMMTMKKLADLKQRKQEVISQLEKVVGKNKATAISNSASNFARQESAHDLDSPTSPYSFFTSINPGPTFVRSDSILADDDYVPYDAPCVSKYGPISRMHKDNVSMNQSVQVPASFRDGSITASLGRRPVSAASPVTPFFFNHQQAAITGHHHPLMGAPPTNMGDGYITIGKRSQQLFFRSMQDPSKELMAESQRVKLQLKNLEKQLNDLKLATQGVTPQNEGDILTQELQIIEQGIQERQKEACLNRIVSTLNQNYQDDATYEEGIANDMKELELMWDEELDKQEKRWSSEEDK
ncbi:PREDICTED: roquin-1 isoform X3 [Nicrophorus vespilloides]|uniref:RING-type E3 ubiquitin transferase n=1 Tax=Nicrophorus vespilloides TaxID=110193 RepID=A0ABM1M5X5_NICVS|nr:PREDICTED: roquin-1 isoform X3 [Nicrophorus vespilloides]